MVKSYLKYASQAEFGVIASGPTLFDCTGKIAVAASLDRVILWHIKKGIQVGCWKDSENTAEVSFMIRMDKVEGNERFAVGYSDGSIRIWNLNTQECLVTFRGHRGEVTALAFDSQNGRIASGSKDTDIIVWDTVTESGLFRLKGHKDQITSLHFLSTDENPTHIVSSSKDTLIKFWELETQHCVETVLGHRSEVWDIEISKDCKVMFSGTSDQELKVWNINLERLSEKISNIQNTSSGAEIENMENAVSLKGDLNRSSKDRIVQISYHPSNKYLVVLSMDKTVEIFKVASLEEQKKKLQRRKKRLLKKDETLSDENLLKLEDEYTSIRIFRTSCKVRAFDFPPLLNSTDIQILLSLTNNSIEVYKFSEKNPEVELANCLDMHGHRSDIRTMALSSDNEIILSAGNASIKIWNVATKQCMRTLPSDYYAVCSAFLPGNRHVVIGTKTGELLIFDTWSATLLEAIKAHEGSVWSIDVRPDKKGLVSGSADKEVKFWDFGAVEDEEFSENAKRLTLVHMRTLKMSDEILCVKYSPNQNLVAVSLLDSTVKVFFHDTLKFFLSLYGHKLPVLCMDISSDNTLLVTGSADKNIKLWGLDFGDCHKSIFAHSDAITQVSFCQDTHYFFSASKDHCLKYWDGDTFEQIQKLDGHIGDIWALCVGKYSNIVVTSGSDKNIRIWEKTEEPLFLEEEREKEMDKANDEELLQGNNNDEHVGLPTMESLKASERIMEAISIAEVEREKWNDYRQALSKGFDVLKPETNPTLQGYGNISAEFHVLKTFEKVKSADLDETLLVLPFSKVISLLQIINIWAQNNWNMQLTSRILLFLLKIHNRHISASRNLLYNNGKVDASISLRPLMESIQKHIFRSITEEKDLIGFNLAGLTMMKRLWALNHSCEFEEYEKETSEMVKQVKSGKSVKKRKVVVALK